MRAIALRSITIALAKGGILHCRRAKRVPHSCRGSDNQPQDKYRDDGDNQRTPTPSTGQHHGRGFRRGGRARPKLLLQRGTGHRRRTVGVDSRVIGVAGIGAVTVHVVVVAHSIMTLWGNLVGADRRKQQADIKRAILKHEY